MRKRQPGGQRQDHGAVVTEIRAVASTSSTPRAGDTISLDMEVTEKKPFSSRDDAGMVTIDTVMTNQDGESVFEGDMKFMIKRDPDA